MNDIRNEIKRIVSGIEPYDDLEKEHIKDTIDWINTAPEIFRIEKPATPLKHLVAFTVLVDPSQRKILLLDHRKALLKLPSGGHVDKNELPNITAKRELQEEMNETDELLFENPLFIDQMTTVGLTAGHIDVNLWYVFKRDSSKPIHDDNEEFIREFSGYCWYSFDEVLMLDIKNLNTNMHRFVRKLIEKGL